jgi:hypothetical protein
MAVNVGVEVYETSALQRSLYRERYLPGNLKIVVHLTCNTRLHRYL